MQETLGSIKRKVLKARNLFIDRKARASAELTTLLPVDILVETYSEVRRSLDAAGIRSWMVSPEYAVRSRVGVDARDKFALADALRSLGEHGYWIRVARPALSSPIKNLDMGVVLSRNEIVTLFKPRRWAGSGQVIAGGYSCEVEIWNEIELHGGKFMRAPRENRASLQTSLDNFELQPTKWHGLDVLTPKVLTKRMLDDIVFPIDVVYTWVDGRDPAWIKRRADAEEQIGKSSFHPEATMPSRFEDHDELKYSLRSLESFAPWIRHVFIVTDRQVPDWLNADHPELTIVDHTQIFDDNSLLPNFNSNSIISRLHHIDGLSEHYIYMNDDVFLGRWLSPYRFFTPNGYAKVSPSNNTRPFSSPRLEDEPHFNLTKNIRSLLEERFGITISRAVKHTPHPQLRSLHYEMEKEFIDTYRATWSHRFRHHTDIVSDQLHHYYAQIVGRAIVAPLAYDYINIKDGSHAGRLRRLLAKRDRDAFCLNDTPVAGVEPVAHENVSRFLNEYFPLPSKFERK